jgi:hypothetical protein
MLLIPIFQNGLDHTTRVMQSLFPVMKVIETVSIFFTVDEALSCGERYGKEFHSIKIAFLIEC